ncbi:hypothetical protein Goklo_029021, partial [Gossypium klotzschianum]|nr:hypothetical protein [Gossypium klotzschianum]
MIQIDKIYSKAVNVPTFLRKLMNIMEMSEQTLGHVDEAVTDLFDRLDKRVLPMP